MVRVLASLWLLLVSALPLAEAQTTLPFTGGSSQAAWVGGTIPLPSDRLAQTNWQHAGLLSLGGIPNRTTQCGSTLNPSASATVTVANGTPGVVTWTAHGMSAGQGFIFALSDPTAFLPIDGATSVPVVAGKLYYVIAAGLATNTFEFSSTQGGSAINLSGSQSGTFTGYKDDQARIASLISGCSSGQVALLGAGTFYMSSGVNVNTSMTLRGAGAGTTILSKINGAQVETSFTASISGTVMTVFAFLAGPPLQSGMPITDSGALLPAGVTITTPVAPAAGGTGSYNLNMNVGTIASEHMTGGQAMGPNPGDLVSLGTSGIWTGTWGSTPVVNQSALSSDANPGDMSITVADGTKFQQSANQIVELSELAMASAQTDPTGMAAQVWAASDWLVYYECATISGGMCTSTPENQIGFFRYDRPVVEMKQVASVSGNTVTFDTPVMRTYRTSHTAQLSYYTNSTGGAYFPHIQQAGLENLSLAHGDSSNADFSACAYCWIKNVESSAWSSVGIEISRSFRSELREFYSHDAAYPRPTGGAYAIGMDAGSSEILIENGISILANKEIVSRNSGAGSVVGYNYMDQSMIDFTPSDTWVEIGLNASHLVGSHHVLFEGNWSQNGDSDRTHGSSTYMLFYRNWLSAVRHSYVNPYTGLTYDDASQQVNGPKRAAGPQSYSYWFSYVGNVLGTSGVTTLANSWLYETCYNGCQMFDQGIWMMGWDNSPDTQTNSGTFAGRIYRDGNWDWLQSQQSWHNTPSGSYPNPMPYSLYRTSKPSFFGANAFPWVNPATGSTGTLPSRARWLSGNPYCNSGC